VNGLLEALPTLEQPDSLEHGRLIVTEQRLQIMPQKHPDCVEHIVRLQKDFIAQEVVKLHPNDFTNSLGIGDHSLNSYFPFFHDGFQLFVVFYAADKLVVFH